MVNNIFERVSFLRDLSFDWLSDQSRVSQRRAQGAGARHHLSLSLPFCFLFAVPFALVSSFASFICGCLSAVWFVCSLGVVFCVFSCLLDFACSFVSWTDSRAMSKDVCLFDRKDFVYYVYRKHFIECLH